MSKVSTTAREGAMETDMSPDHNEAQEEDDGAVDAECFLGKFLSNQMEGNKRHFKYEQKSCCSYIPFFIILILTN